MKLQKSSLRAYSVDELCRAYPFSRSIVYEAANAGLLEFRYVGTKPIVTEESVQKFIATLPKEPIAKSDRVKTWKLSSQGGLK